MPSELHRPCCANHVLRGAAVTDSHRYQLRQIPCKNTVAGGESSAGCHDAITVPRDSHSCPAALGYIAMAALCTMLCEWTHARGPASMATL